MTESNQRPHVIKDARGKRPDFFDDPAADQAMSMILVLASELSVLRNRMDSAERVAKAKGFDLAAAIEDIDLDQAALEEREAWRQGLMDRLFYLMRKSAAEARAEETRDGYNAIIEDIARR